MSLPVLSSHFHSTYYNMNNIFHKTKARRADSDGGMSASGSAGPGFDPRRGIKFSFENFQPRS